SSPANVRMVRRFSLPKWANRWLRITLNTLTVLLFVHLCFGEVAPQSVRRRLPHLQHWSLQQIVLLSGLSCLLVLIANLHSQHANASNLVVVLVRLASPVLSAVNCLALLAALIATAWSTKWSNCPMQEECNHLPSLLDSIGLVSARLARLDLAACLQLAVRGDAAWLLQASDGWLGYAEGMPLHRLAGWWCIGQSTLHSISYLLYYFETGGWLSLWRNCLPVPLENDKINRRGLINGFGILALLALIPLAVSAFPRVRQCSYHVFQRLHLPASLLFVVFGVLHDLPMLLFSVMALAGWYLGRVDATSVCSRKRLPAKIRLLPGTSGPWVELTVDCETSVSGSRWQSPRGEWALVRVLPLGREWHPLSLTLSLSKSPSQLCMLISSNAGDWSTSLVALARSQSAIEVDVAGPYSVGGGHWSLSSEVSNGEHELLLVAGGTGVTGWLPCLTTRPSGRRSHLVWCVQKESDYLALASRLPRLPSTRVTVYVTRPSEAHWLRPNQHREISETVAASTCAGQQPVSGSTLGCVSLVAALVGLGIGWKGWKWVTFTSSSSTDSLLGYATWRRCWPIVAAALAVIAVTHALQRIFISLLPRLCKKHCFERDNHDVPQLPHAKLFTGDSSSEERSANVCGDSMVHQMESGPHEPEVKPERPDLGKLVKTAATTAQVQRLVVAVCGPTKLADAVREAVATVHKEHPDLHIELSCNESAW
ncbi:MAG: hypothetical protein SGPRY_013937, partial [Prymnesium sp.]